MIDSKNLPQIKLSEIVEQIRDMGIAITDRDLIEPVPERLVVLYEQLAERLLGVSKEKLRHLSSRQPVDTGDEQCQELNQVYRLNKILCAMLPALGIHDFHLSDLTAPEPRRLPRIMSALVNYSLFKDTQDVKNHDKLHGHKENLEAVQQSNEAVAQIDQLVGAKRQQVDEENEMAAHLEEANQQLLAGVEGMNAKQASLQSEAHKLKKSVADTENLLTTLEFELQDLRAQVDELRAQVVEDSGDIVDRLEELRQQDVTERETRADLTRTVEDTQKGIQALLDALNAMETMVGHVNTLKDATEGLVVTHKEMTQANEQLSTQANTKATQNTLLQELQQDYKERQHNRQQQVKTIKAKKSEVGQLLARLLEEESRLKGIETEFKDKVATLTKKHTRDMGLLSERLYQLQVKHDGVEQKLRRLIEQSCEKARSVVENLEGA